MITCLNNLEIPVELSLAFDKNLDSFKYFNQLPRAKQTQIVQMVNELKSKEDVENYVNNFFSLI